MLEFLAAFVLSYLWHGMGITVGYHRFLAHRSFRCNKLFERIFVAGGYLAYQGSPVWWSAIHRTHHRYSDTLLDPHSPRNGLMQSLFGWMLSGTYPDHIIPGQVCPDLVKDRIYMFLECGGHPGRASLLNLVINIVFRSGLWFFLGWQVAVANLLASGIVFTVPLCLNVICHLPKQGYKNFVTSDDGLNVWWVGLMGLGEGWHNNHHAFPGSAQTGLRWFELDISWLTINLARKIGWVSFANVPSGFKRRLAKRQGAFVRLRRFRRIRQLKGAAA